MSTDPRGISLRRSSELAAADVLSVPKAWRKGLGVKTGELFDDVERLEE